MPPGAVKVDRSTRWGNPWRACHPGPDGRIPPDAEGATGMFRDALSDPERRAMAAYPSDDEIRRHLRGRNLACWCRPGSPCHADVLLEIANA